MLRVRRRHEGHGQSLGARPTRATDPVDIVLDLIRKLVVNYALDVLPIRRAHQQPIRSPTGAHQELIRSSSGAIKRTRRPLTGMSRPRAATSVAMSTGTTPLRNSASVRSRSD